MLKDQQAYVSLEYHDQWLEITLNRPASFNALSQKNDGGAARGDFSGK